jgi:hypothetical protein
MTTHSEDAMHSYRVHYKAFYLEHCEFAHHDVEATSARRALQAFFRVIRAALPNLDQVEAGDLSDLRRIDLAAEYSWWEGDWLMSYRWVEEVNGQPRATRSGTGVAPLVA